MTTNLNNILESAVMQRPVIFQMADGLFQSLATTSRDGMHYPCLYIMPSEISGTNLELRYSIDDRHSIFLILYGTWSSGYYYNSETGTWEISQR